MALFQRRWDKLELPITGKIAVIDHGEPAVGLSAMQLNALDIHSGIVKMEFRGKTCEAKVWNACGMNATKGDDTIRLSDGAAKMLGCKVGDNIDFVKIVARTLPVNVGPIS